MAVLDFPANPVLNQEYNFPPFRYRWDGEKWRTIGTGANPVQTQIAEHKVEKDAHAIETITNLREELSALGGTPVLSVVWVQKRDAMWPGYVPADGQTLSRADYPDAWQAIDDDKVPAVLDSEWLADSWRRGCFTPGDGSTTFRIPDYNGKYAGSMGAVFLRGDGQNSGVTNGYIQDSGIKSHDAGLHYQDGRHTSLNSASAPNGGLRFQWDNMPLDPHKGELLAKYIGENETRPINVTGCWAIKLAGAAQNAGQIDALDLYVKLSEANAKIEELQSWPQSGADGNGNWVKHRDGTMTCYRVFEGTVAPAGQTTQGIYYGQPLSQLPFPAHFVSPPTASVEIISLAGNNTFWFSYASPTTTTHWPGGYPFSELPIASGVPIRLQLTATGRWK